MVLALSPAVFGASAVASKQGLRHGVIQGQLCSDADSAESVGGWQDHLLQLSHS